ncbi:cell division protein PerM [Kitasatospora azatica]|uniref:cell division protein PerM n=1 Tax=Kitasatospora azatica TaxID=58347 RepID=UPI0012FC0699|nr:DUF6350 family protein [Kitasatospora azatica]
MTHHLTGRPIPGHVGTPASGPALAGATAALLGLALTGVPVLVLWVLTATPQDSAADAARLAGALWLLAHGGPLTRGGAGAPLSLTPLLLTLAAVLLLRRAGARAAATAGVRSATVPAALCAGYLAVALPVALACRGAGALRAEPLPDLLAVALLGYGSAALGARTGPRWWPALRRRVRRLSERLLTGLLGRLPERWSRAVRRPELLPPPTAVGQAAAAGLLTLLAGGALLFGTALLLRADATDPAVRELSAGSLPGVLGLLLTCLLLAPNAVLWATGYALGPGFRLGADTVVAPGQVRLGVLPDFPLFALAPTSASGWQRLVLLVPLLAGAVAAGLLGRVAAAVGPHPEDGSDAAPWRPATTALAGLATSLTAGTAVAAAGWLAQGAVGTGRMAELGPSWACGLAAAGWFALVTVPGATALRWWLLRRAEAEQDWAQAELDWAAPEGRPARGRGWPVLRWWLLRRAEAGPEPDWAAPVERSKEQSTEQCTGHSTERSTGHSTGQSARSAALGDRLRRLTGRVRGG